MEFYTGVKLWQVGEADVVYAPNEEEAYKVMENMMGKEDLEEIIADDPIAEFTQESFDSGQIRHDINREKEDLDAPLISFRESLDAHLEDESISGHFSTNEY